MKRKTTFSIIAALSVSLATVVGGYIAKSYKDNSAQPIERAEAAYNPGTTYNVSDTKAELDSYYSSISDTATGSSLLSQLRTLNSSKRKKTVGYSTMGTSTSGAFVYTDYDLKATATDSKGQKYGTKVASFYTKTSATSWNREHTWPKSHGGNLIEDDILMTRPTITAENSNRGNSFYVEGKSSQSNGWDPYTAGYAEWCRGECARIILYGVVANSNLNLTDSDSHSTSNANPDNLMGNINTLIKWHFNYSPNQYEINRNNGGEYLQGNRNPFVDHPEYVAKIWSNFNSTVSTICSQKSGMYANWTPGSCSTYGTNDAVSGGGTNTDSVMISQTTIQLAVGESTNLIATTNDNSNVTYAFDDMAYKVLNFGTQTTFASGEQFKITGIKDGTTTITVTSPNGGSATCVVTVGTGQYIEPSKPDKKNNNKVNLPLVIGLSGGGGAILVAGLVVLIILLVKKKHA